MQDYYYAQINGENIAIGVSQLSGQVIAENMIPITEDQYNIGPIIGYRYDRLTNTWIYVPPPPNPKLHSESIPVTEL